MVETDLNDITAKTLHELYTFDVPAQDYGVVDVPVDHVPDEQEFVETILCNKNDILYVGPYHQGLEQYKMWEDAFPDVENPRNDAAARTGGVTVRLYNGESPDDSTWWVSAQIESFRVETVDGVVEGYHGGVKHRDGPTRAGSPSMYFIARK